MYFLSGIFLALSFAAHCVRWLVIRGIVASIEDGTIQTYDKNVLKFLVVGMDRARKSLALLGFGLLFTKLIWQ